MALDSRPTPGSPNVRPDASVNANRRPAPTTASSEAAQLRARMQQQGSPASRPTGATRPASPPSSHQTARPVSSPSQSPRPTNAVPRAGVQPSAPRPASAQAPRTGAQMNTAGPRPTESRPASSPSQSSRPRPVALSSPTPRTEATPHTELPRAMAPARTAPPAADSYKRAEEMQKRQPAAGAPTRQTDVRAIREAAASADATRLTDVSDIRTAPLIPKQEEIKDESEGSNTLISILKAITYIVAVVVVSVFLSVFIILVGNDIYAFVKDDAKVSITVPEYATLDDMATLLYENGLIAYPSIFKLYANFKSDDGQFLAGEYTELTPMMNYDELLLAFKPKKPTGISRITIPEGYTTDEIIDLFVSKGIGTREGYVDVINHYDFDYWFIDELEAQGISEDRFYRLDGYLFPDTYEFYNASTEEVVIGKLLKRFNEVFSESFITRAQQLGYSVDQILILASMVEKEGGVQSDFFDISSVFHNRLKNASAYPYLQSDATVVYAIHHDTGERINPTGEDMEYVSPYNSYTNPGLPPGPIANPSASAIRAALYPSDTKYFYFVSASSHLTYFAQTKAEHDANIARIKAGTVQTEPVT